MARQFAYPVTLTPDLVDGGFLVTVPDLPECITQGEDRADALRQAADALDEAFAGRMRRGDELPLPSPCAEGQFVLALPALTAAKAALHLALREAGRTRSDLASQLGCDEKEVRRLLDPRHRSALRRLQEALAILGKRIAVSMQDAAA